MKVSIIIPVYNVQAYLRQCVQSVLAQTYHDMEIVLVDDGSTDSSGALCDALAAEDERIHVVHKPNGGLSDARNVGLQHATGEYIAFLDGDDVWLERDGLRQMMVSAEQSAADILLFQCVDIYPHRKQPRREYDIEYINTHTAQEVFDKLVRTQAFNMSACFQLIRRDLLIKNEVYFEKGLLSEDIDWSLRLWRYVQHVQAVNIPMYGYQHRSESITTSYSIRNLRSYDHIFCKFCDMYQQEHTKSSKESSAYWATALGYLAQMYVSCLYSYNRIACKDRKEAKQILRTHEHLLEHSISRKSDRVVKCRRIMGLDITIRLFALYGTLKRKTEKTACFLLRDMQTYQQKM